MGHDASADPQNEQHHGVPDQDAEPPMTEPNDRGPDPQGEPVVDPPVMDGAQELQAEAEVAIESGEVDLSDTRRGGPSVVEHPEVRG